jgi:hypothetical protein
VKAALRRFGGRLARASRAIIGPESSKGFSFLKQKARRLWRRFRVKATGNAIQSGNAFCAAMDARQRRQAGAHYTSERDILKVIGPLFLDELTGELHNAAGDAPKLTALQDRLAKMRLLDPACGCGNFLVIAYRELRLLELEIVRRLVKQRPMRKELEAKDRLKLCAAQLHGIEIDETAARTAESAIRAMDRRLDRRVRDEVGVAFVSRARRAAPRIRCGSALRIDWNDVLPAHHCAHILGNPPFVGAKFQTRSQRSELAAVAGGVKNVGVLDYAAGWYFKAAQYIQGTAATVAFVSTSSICQGEQVGVLWPALMARYGVTIQFAHRTFPWTSEARDKARVHVVIIGFGLDGSRPRRLFDYENGSPEPSDSTVVNIGPYLIDGRCLTIRNRSTPLCAVPEMQFGNQPIDGGHLILSSVERQVFLDENPALDKLVRPYVGSREFINSSQRWCLWLKGASPPELKASRLMMQRINAVREFRLRSRRPATRALADTPTLFAFISHCDRPYLLVPSVSSERRQFIPMGFMNANAIASNLCLTVPDATLYHFGVLSSTMHMAWVRHVAGRLESRYRYSAKLVYNNFPWPQDKSDSHRGAVEMAAQAVLDARGVYPDSSLADLYDPLSMPANLAKAHERLDRAVDRCYRSQPFATERKRVEYLFTLYEQLASPLIPAKRTRSKKSP